MPVRHALGLALCAVLAVTPVIPPEHVHEVEEHGHAEFVAHRHFVDHGIASPHHAATHQIDHDDATVATVSDDFIVPLTAPIAAPPLRFVDVIFEPPPSTLVQSVDSVEPLIHGPPRAPTDERGPPSSHLL